MDRQPLFSLTEMTGPEAQETRTIVVSFIEMPFRVFILIIVGAVTGALPALMLGLISFWVGAIFFGTWVGGTVWLFYGRTRRGLKIHHYVSLLNKVQSKTNVFMLGTTVIAPDQSSWSIVTAGSTANPAARIRPRDQLAAERTPVDPIRAIFD